jgi:hypothetical protein
VQVEYWEEEEVCVTYAYKLLRCIYLEGSLESLAKNLFEEGAEIQVLNGAEDTFTEK